MRLTCALRAVLTAAQAFAAAAAAVLLRTMHPTVAGGDSGELMGAACELGVAHPPGYPLFTMISWLGTQAIPFGSPGYRLNCVSVAFAVLAALFHFHAVLRWHLALVRVGGTHGTPAGDEKWRGSAWVALMSSGLLTFCPLLWQYSTHAEVFAMNNMFIAALLYLGVRYVQERAVVWARLGALTIGLGLCNQHTLLLFAVPLVASMLWHGRSQLLAPREMCVLCLLGLLGLTPYLYLLWAATHAPLGSWGDTSWGRMRTEGFASGWPAVGFWTHFFRREYGTLKLYSGEEKGGAGQLGRALQLYAVRLLGRESLYLGAAAAVGVVRALGAEGFGTQGGGVGFSAVVLGMFCTYMVVFHYLANLPLDQPLFVGVHMRFWMQAHLPAFGFLGIGIERILSAARLWRRRSAAALALGLVTTQVALNFRMQDQSRNYHVWNFGHVLLDARPQHAIVLTQGDLVTNSIRYLQRCEKYRLDVAHLDMPMMTYEWFKTMHGPHFPHPPEGKEVVLPGIQFAVGGKKLLEHRRCCPYSMKQFLDANFPSKRPIYIMGGWYGSEMPDGKSQRMPDGSTMEIPGYTTEMVGAGARIVKYGKPMKKKEWKEEVAKFKVPDQMPEPWLYDETSWERTLTSNYITYVQSLWVHRMEKAVAKGKEAEGSPWVKDQAEIKRVIKKLEEALAWAEAIKNGEEDLYRNLGIAWGRLKCESGGVDYPKVPCEGQTKMREYMGKFLNVTSKSKEETQGEHQVVDNPTAFINLG